MYDIHPFNCPFMGEPWKELKVSKAYKDIMPSCHWRVQELINASIIAGLSIREIAELFYRNKALFTNSTEGKYKIFIRVNCIIYKHI